jgi:chemosensory pili system protein ChpA (sensor histidine kinase/response regulator)
MNSLDGVKVEKLANILKKQQDNETAEFEYGGKNYEYVYLGKLLDMDVQAKLESVDASIPMLLVSGKDRNYALHIDAIIENRDLVVKSLSKQFAAMPGIGGGVIMPDGNVAIVLDLVSLVSQTGDGEQADAMELLEKITRKEGESRPRLIMVVDDSITVRKVTSATLKRHGLEVITAKNGLEALELLETQLPDVILLDIEMPKMDGFEVATHIRKQPPPIGTIPIIMITSRIGDKHRTRAQEIGVNEFMSKPFVEEVLIEHIRSYRKQ